MSGGAVTNHPWGSALEEGSEGWSGLAGASGRGSYGEVLKFIEAPWPWNRCGEDSRMELVTGKSLEM